MSTTEDAPRDDGVERVRRQFGRAADDYATSEVHARGESLGMLVDLLTAGRRTGRALDVATGAGHTALAIAPHVDEVVASDVTEEMLATASRLARERGIANVRTTLAQAEELPFPDHSFELVTCRIALHHFTDPGLAAREMARVLTIGGRLGFTDNVTVPDDEGRRRYNEFERLRDPSHHEVLPEAELERLFTTAGLVVRERHRLSKEFEFHAWANRQRVTPPDRERLLEMMRSMPESALELFQPRWADNTLYFSLWELVIIAEKP